MNSHLTLGGLFLCSALAVFFVVAGCLQIWRLVMVEKEDGATTKNAGIVYLNAWLIGLGIGCLVLVLKSW